jgi:chemotaxis protein CheX
MPQHQAEKHATLEIDPVLLDAVITGTREGLEMTGLCPPPVGASRFVSNSRPISVMVGLVGRTNGTCAVSLTERGMLHVASRLMGEEFKSVNAETVDAIGEIGNMIAGRVKELLVGTEYEMQNISVPSVIIGQNYGVHYARGMHTISVDFELVDMPLTDLRERFFTTSLSLLRRVAG